MGKPLYRSLFLVPIVILTSLSSAQDYRPLRSGMKRAFAEPEALSRMFSMSLDSVVTIGADTLLFNYLKLNDTISHYAGCGYLGGDECNRQDLPAWTGREIRSQADGHLSISTTSGDTLLFAFPTAGTDTAWFHVDADQRFGLQLLATDTASFLGIQDSARFYRVIHTDLEGEVIQSAIHDAPVTIGKELGLAEFFQIDSFPAVLRPLRMIGDANHEVGLHCITQATVHDLQPGDEVQYRHFEFSVFPTTTSGTTWKEIVTERWENDTAVFYTFEQTHFNDGDPKLYGVDLITRSYSKLDTVAAIPFEEFEGMNKHLVQRDLCGQRLWLYTYDPDNLWEPCPWGPCWTSYVNGWGPNPDSEAYHLLGVGSGYWFSQQFINTPWDGLQYVSHTTYIPYFKKDGLSCGTEMFVGLSEVTEQDLLFIEPNPSAGPVRIRATVPISRIDVLDLRGRVFHSAGMSGSDLRLDLVDLPVGLYVLHIRFQGGAEAIRKLVLSR